MKSKLIELSSNISEIKQTRDKNIAEVVELARVEERSKFEQDSHRIIEAGLISLTLARESFEKFLAQSENLSFHLLELALTPLFTNTQLIKQTLGANISKSIAIIGTSSILKVRLNGEDFGEISELINIQPDLKSSNLSIEIDVSLATGECVFDLIIGEYEISLTRHWDVLKSHLAEQLSNQSDFHDLEVQ